MARLNRQLVSASRGGYHVISRVTGGDFLLQAEEKKDYFLKLLQRFVAGYFMQLHSFAIMSNHFHLLITVSEEAVAEADSIELAHRLWTVNTGEFQKRGDEENKQKMGMKLALLQEVGLEQVRTRLGSISRFVQDLKQCFARHFNHKHQRLGCLWGSRFKGVIVSHGNAQLACGAYIDLNPVRAGIVEKPEDYRWCSLGLLKKSPEVAKYLLSPVQLAETEKSPWVWYKSFVYESGGLTTGGKPGGKPDGKPDNNTSVRRPESVVTGSEVLLSSVVSVMHAAQKKCQELQLDGRLINRIRNLSEGIVAGSAKLIADMQEKLQRCPREPRELWEGCPFFTTRIFHQRR